MISRKYKCTNAIKINKNTFDSGSVQLGVPITKILSDSLYFHYTLSRGFSHLPEYKER